MNTYTYDFVYLYINFLFIITKFHNSLPFLLFHNILVHVPIIIA